jgi:hypothetical protein
MWVDQNGVVHTVWVPPEAVLGEESAAALRAVPLELAEAAVAELNARYDGIVEGALPHAPSGPVDFERGELEELPYPPVFTGLVPTAGESLATTVLRFLDAVPSQWRIEVLEAVCDVLEPDDAEVVP